MAAFRMNDETNAMQDFFRNNLQHILREKGCRRKCDMVEFLTHLAAQNRAGNYSVGAMSRWVYDGWLPKFKTLEQLAIWLGCETTDLLPEMYHKKLKGFDDNVEQPN